MEVRRALPLRDIHAETTTPREPAHALFGSKMVYDGWLSVRRVRAPWVVGIFKRLPALNIPSLVPARPTDDHRLQVL